MRCLISLLLWLRHAGQSEAHDALAISRIALRGEMALREHVRGLQAQGGRWVGSRCLCVLPVRAACPKGLIGIVLKWRCMARLACFTGPPPLLPGNTQGWNDRKVTVGFHTLQAVLICFCRCRYIYGFAILARPTKRMCSQQQGRVFQV